MENYATIEELKTTMGTSWDDSKTTFAEMLLTDCSAGLRQIFRNHGLSLDNRITDGLIEPTILRRIVCDMVSRNLSGTLTPLAGDYSQMSQSAGGYSISVSSNGSNLYLKRDQAKWLGLPNLTFNNVSLFGGRL